MKFSENKYMSVQIYTRTTPCRNLSELSSHVLGITIVIPKTWLESFLVHILGIAIAIRKPDLGPVSGTENAAISGDFVNLPVKNGVG